MQEAPTISHTAADGRPRKRYGRMSGCLGAAAGLLLLGLTGAAEVRAETDVHLDMQATAQPASAPIEDRFAAERAAWRGRYCISPGCGSAAGNPLVSSLAFGTASIATVLIARRRDGSFC